MTTGDVWTWVDSSDSISMDLNTAILYANNIMLGWRKEDVSTAINTTQSTIPNGGVTPPTERASPTVEASPSRNALLFTGAIVGLSIGVAAIVILVFSGALVVFRRLRKRRLEGND